MLSRSLVAALATAAVAALVSCSACSKSHGSSGDTPTHVTDGKVLFATYCSRCHGPDGRGGPASEAGPGPRNFHDKAFHASHSDEQLRAVITGGKGMGMPAFGATFDDEQLKALIGQLRTFGDAP